MWRVCSDGCVNGDGVVGGVLFLWCGLFVLFLGFFLSMLKNVWTRER